jgi:putative ABC transport system permease protein
MEFDRDIIEVSFRNLKREGMRTFLTLIGVIIGIAAIVSLLSIGNGLSVAVEEQFQSLGTNTIFVIPGGGMTVAKIKINQTDLDAIESVSGVDYAIPIYSKSGMLGYNGEKVSVSVNAVDGKKAEILKNSGIMEVSEGRMIEKNDSEGIIIGSKIATDFFKRDLSLRKQILINGVNYNVVGILKPQQAGFGGAPNSGGAVYMSLEGFKRIVPESNLNPSIVFVKTITANDAKDSSDKIKDYFDEKYGEKSVLVSSSEELLEQVKTFLNLITIFITGIGAVSMLVGGIGIMNSMVTSVMERTREIGLMKALGASNAKIKNIFLLEAALIGGIGGIIGIILGYTMAITIALIGQSLGYALNASISIEVTMGALIFSMIVGSLSGVIPAINASKLDPVVALRYE